MLIFSDGHYLTKGKGLLGLSDEWQLRNAESFSSSRLALIEGLIQSLEGRFEMEAIIQAMKIANFKVWPLPEEADKIEGFSHL